VDTFAGELAMYCLAEVEDKARTLQWGCVDFENRCLKWGKDKTASGTGRVVPLSQRAVAALSFWATHFPERKPEHYVFPAERYGAGGDEFSPKAYHVDPIEAHREHQGTMGSGQTAGSENSERRDG
jgi:hypothetical protein